MEGGTPPPPYSPPPSYMTAIARAPSGPTDDFNWPNLTQTPQNTKKTDVQTWLPALKASFDPQRPVVVRSMTHRKALFRLSQHEGMDIVLSSQGQEIHLFVERNPDPNDGTFANDTLSVLSAADWNMLVSATSVVETHSWTNPRSPPFLDVLEIIVCLSTVYPRYELTRHNCYFYSSVAFKAVGSYDLSHSPSTRPGSVFFKSSAFVGIKIGRKEADEAPTHVLQAFRNQRRNDALQSDIDAVRTDVGALRADVSSIKTLLSRYFGEEETKEIEDTKGKGRAQSEVDSDSERASGEATRSIMEAIP